MKNGLVLGASVFLAGLSFGTELVAGEEWNFERVRGGVYAQVCSDRYRQQVCAGWAQIAESFAVLQRRTWHPRRAWGRLF